MPAADTASLDVFTELRSCDPPLYAVATGSFEGIAVRSLRWADDALAYTDFRDSMLPGSYRLRVEDERGCVSYRAIELPDFGPMDVQVLAKAPTCAEGGDGEVTLEVSGGVPGYAAGWEDFDIGVNRRYMYAGRYRGVIYDSVGCSIEFVAEVPAAPAMEVRVEVRNADCADQTSGFVRVSVRGGVAPYLYSLDGAPYTNDRELAGLAPGPHRVTVQDAGFCESDQAFTVGSTGTAAKSYTAEELGLPTTLLAGDTIELSLR